MIRYRMTSKTGTTEDTLGTQKRHGNPRGVIRKLGDTKFAFLFQRNINALTRLNSQINVLMFMSKML